MPPEVLMVGKKDNADSLATAAVITTAIQEASGIIKELERVAIASPLASTFICLVVGDILAHAGRKQHYETNADGSIKRGTLGFPYIVIDQEGIISNGTWIGIQALLYANGGIALASEVIDSITQITDIFGSNRKADGLSQGSINTLVISPDVSSAQLSAVLGKLTQKS